MLGAIIGDIIGSSYEFGATKSMDFELFPASSRFTDDTVLTVAIADCLLNNKDYAKTVYEYGKKYPYIIRSSTWLMVLGMVFLASPM